MGCNIPISQGAWEELIAGLQDQVPCLAVQRVAVLPVTATRGQQHLVFKV